MKFLKYILFLLVLISSVEIVAQEAAPKKSESPATTRAKRKKAKQKWKEQRKIEMEQKKAVKQHHKRIQTKETRKRMKRERRKSDNLRKNKKEFFLIRWFRK